MKTLNFKFILLICSAFLFQTTLFAKPKYPAAVVPLSKDHAYFQTAKTTDFWELIPHYRPQMTGHSCSIASVNVIFNALSMRAGLTSDDKLFNEDRALEKANDKVWIQNVSKDGKGMTLEELRSSTENSLKALGFKSATVSSHYGSEKDFNKIFTQDLISNEKSDKEFIVINFDQGLVMQDEPAGHISPVGAYDSKTKRALILDTDRDWYEPYWVSVETLSKSMNTIDKSTTKTRGYILIKL